MAVLVCMAMAMAVMPGVALADMEGVTANGLVYSKYTIFNTNYVEITDYTGNAAELVIPAEIDGNQVTKIGFRAFYNCDSLTNVTIPNSVISIGESAFENCTGLTNVHIGNSVTSIGGGAFSFCSNLTNVILPDSVTSIGTDAFSFCSNLTSVHIGNNVNIIGGGAFRSCNSLTNIDIPASVTSIGLQAFAPCNGLTMIEVDANNTHYTSRDGVLFNDNLTELVQYPSGSPRTGYDISDSVTSIGDSAFYYCTNLQSVDIPDSVTSIGENAFFYCPNFKSVDIPDSVTYVGLAAFSNCYELTSVTIPDGVTSISAYMFAECSGLTSVTIPNSVTSISDSAFFDSGLTNVNIPNGVTSIGNSAFENCYDLTSVTISDSVADISYNAFRCCDNLTSIEVDTNNAHYTSRDGVLFNREMTELIQYPIGNSRTDYDIPDSVTSIVYVAFSNCTGLQSISIPDSVNSIGSRAFASCDGLTDVYYAGSEEDWANIEIVDYGNDPLLNANIHYNSKGPDAPVEPEIPEIKEPTVTVDESASELNVTVEAENIPASAALVAVGYGADGNYVSKADVEAGSASLPAEGVETVKVFCWESLESMRPICPAKEITVQ